MGTSVGLFFGNIVGTSVGIRVDDIDGASVGKNVGCPVSSSSSPSEVLVWSHSVLPSLHGKEYGQSTFSHECSMIIDYSYSRYLCHVDKCWFLSRVLFWVRGRTCLGGTAEIMCK